MIFSGIAWNVAVPSDSNTDRGGATLKSYVDDCVSRGITPPSYTLIEWNASNAVSDGGGNAGFLVQFCTDSNFDPLTSSNIAIVGAAPSNNFYWAQDGQITSAGMFFRLGCLEYTSNSNTGSNAQGQGGGSVSWDSNANFIEGFSNAVVGSSFWSLNGRSPAFTDFLTIYGSNDAHIASASYANGITLLETNGPADYYSTNGNLTLPTPTTAPTTGFVKEYGSMCVSLDASTNGFFAYPTLFSDPGSVSALSPCLLRYGAASSTSNMGYVQNFALPIDPPPGQPTGVTVTAGDTRATVYWTAPADGGTPTYYDVVSTSINDGSTTTTTVAYPASACVVGGLTNYWPYTFVVVAVNATGPGIASSVSSQITPMPSVLPPGQPVITSVEAGNAKVGIYWTPPLSGGPPTGYNIVAQPAVGGSSNTTYTFSVGTSPTNTVLTGLQNDVAYVMTVTGFNTGGSGTASQASSVVTPSASIVAPDPVGTCTAVPGDGNITVSWTPAVAGGPVTSYEVLATPVSGGNPFQTSVAGTATSTYITGLTNGTAYSVAVIAINIEGQSSATYANANANVTPMVPVVPDPVTGVVGVPGDRQITVSWTPASGGPSPDHYFAIASDTGNLYAPSYAEVSFPATSATVPGLIDGVVYDVQVIAVLGSYSSTPAYAYSITPILVVSPPGQVTGLQGTPGNGNVSLSWSVPASGGTPDTFIATATASSGQGMDLTQTTTYPNTFMVFAGLSNEQPYDFYVTASNAGGLGPASGTITGITPHAPPNSVLSVSVVSVTNTSATISWVPDTSGASVSYYNVYAINVRGSPFRISAPTTQYTIGGLSANTTYNNIVFVEAFNSVANSGPVYAPSFTTLVDPPGTVTGTVATPGDASASVSWNFSGSGGLPDTFVIYATPSTGPVLTTSVPFPNANATFAGLTNGTAYTFRVAGSNASGMGTASSPSASIVPEAQPNPVSAISIAGVTSTSVTLIWTPDTTGGYIGWYIVDAYGIQGSPFTVVAPTTQTTISGLNPSTTYNGLIGIQAANAVSSSAFVYAPSFTTLTQVVLPGQPIGVTATAGNGTANIGWTAPVTGGLPSSYVVSVIPVSGGATTTTTTPTSDTTYDVTGLTNGSSYTFTVAGSNAAGIGPASASTLPVTPLGAPNPVLSVSVVAVSNYSVTLSWVPDLTGGAVQFYYIVAPSIVGSPFIVQSPNTQGTFTGFQIGTTYHHFVSVMAANTISSSTAVYAPDFTTLTAPDPVNSVQVSPGNGAITVLWIDPVTSGTPDYYAVTAIPTTGTGPSVTTDVSFVSGRSSQSTTVTGLTDGVPYLGSVVAVNVAGSSSPVVSSSTATPETVPNPVLSISIVQVGDGFVSISWVPDTSGGVIQYFYVTFPGLAGSPFVIDYPTTQMTISGLTNGYEYIQIAYITAANTVSTSALTYIPPFMPMKPPNQVTLVTAVAGDQQATVSWTPAVAGGTPTQYTVTATSLANPAVVASVAYPASSLVVTGLTNLTTYTFTVTSINAAGQATTIDGVAVRIGLPGPARSVTATPGDTTATVYWTGTITGGTPNYYLLTATSYAGVVVTATVSYTFTTGTITGLINGTTYLVTVTAANNAGNSSPASAIQPVTPYSTVITPGGGGDPHITTIYGVKYLLPNAMRNVVMLAAVDHDHNIYHVSATTRFMTTEELLQKKAFCVSRVLDARKGYVARTEVRTVDDATASRIKEMSCFETFAIKFNSSVVRIDAFTGDKTVQVSNDEIAIIPTQELMKTSTGNRYYPRTAVLKSFDVVFGKVVCHMSIDRTFADVNYVRFDVDGKDFRTLSGAIITRIS